MLKQVLSCARLLEAVPPGTRVYGVSESSRMHFSPDTWRGQFAGNYAVGPGASRSALSGEAEEEENSWKQGRGHQV